MYVSNCKFYILVCTLNNLAPLADANSFTGFRNFNQCSCYMNVVLQLFCQTDILTEYFAQPSGGDQAKQTDLPGIDATAAATAVR